MIDHGWCFGYTCQKRISTFKAMVAPSKNYDIYLSSTPPKQLRFRILNSDSSYKVRLSMYYFTSMRIDLYLNGVYVPPTNAEYIGSNMVLKNVSGQISSYKPTYMNASGVNLFDNRQIFFTLSGGDFVDLQIAPVLFISFNVPAMTPEQFFEPATLVNNFATLLGLSPTQIKTVNIISATNSSSFNGRRKRDLSSNIMINLTIYDNAVRFLNDTVGLSTSLSTLSLVSAKVSNQFATGQLQESAIALFNVTLVSLNIRPPQSAPNASDVSIGQVNNLNVIQQASGCNAQVPCQVQPILQLVDQNVI
jgi:hypothetical protein